MSTKPPTRNLNTFTKLVPHISVVDLIRVFKNNVQPATIYNFSELKQLSAETLSTTGRKVVNTLMLNDYSTKNTPHRIMETTANDENTSTYI